MHKRSPRFQRRPVVVSRVESTPTGNNPHVGPRVTWSMRIRCFPCVTPQYHIGEVWKNGDYLPHPGPTKRCHR